MLFIIFKLKRLNTNQKVLINKKLLVFGVNSANYFHVVYLLTSENFFQSYYTVVLINNKFYSMFKTEESNHIDKMIHSKSFLFVFKTTSLNAEIEFCLV